MLIFYNGFRVRYQKSKLMASAIYRLLKSSKMATVFGKHFLVTGSKTVCKQRSYLSTSCSSMIKWRYEKDIEPNPNRFGPLKSLPDYSFVDGRPVPLSQSQIKKLELQESYCKRIMQLSHEIDFAVERYKQMDHESKENRRKILESKLKEKGESPQPRKK